MYSPVKGRLRRTHHDGVFVKFALSEQDYSLQAKVGHVQVCMHTLQISCSNNNVHVL